MLKVQIDTLAAILRHRGWLADTPSDFADALLSHCQWRTHGPGVAIQHAGDTGGMLFGVARGTLALTTSLAAPDTPMTHIVHPGLWFGWVPMFVGRERPNSVVTRSEVALACLSQAGFEALLAEHPHWWRHAGALGVQYGNIAVNIAADLMIRDSRRRCEAALLRLADCRFSDSADGNAVEALMTQDELAAIANLSRTSVNAILRTLEAEGLISLGYRSVVLHDPARLRAQVDDG